jgi:hypothetical protein
MLHEWWQMNMDARRSLSLLIAVVGWAVLTLGIAASPVSTFGAAVGSVFWAAVGPVFGAALAGYVSRRVSDPERALLSAVAFGATAAVILTATFGMAAAIRPNINGIPGFADVWYGAIVSGLVVAFVGAFLWRRDSRGRWLAAMGLLGVFLVVGWVISAASGNWAAAAQDFPLSATGVAFIALAVCRSWPLDPLAATSAT